MIGDVGSVRDALVQIVLRLRDFVLRDRDGPRAASPTDSLFPGARTTTPATESLFSGSSRSAPAPDSFYSSTLRSAPVADSLYSGGLSVPSTYSSIPPVAPLNYEQRVETGSGMGMLPSSSLYRYGSLQVLSTAINTSSYSFFELFSFLLSSINSI